MSIPITSPLSYIGVFLMIAGFFLLLSGLNIVKIEKISVTPGTRTWILGLVLAVIGLAFLWGDRAPVSGAVQPTATVEPLVQVVTATLQPTNTSQPPTSTSVPATVEPTPENTPTPDAGESPTQVSEQMQAIYQALKLKNLNIEPAKALPGDSIKVQYKMVNSLSQNLSVPVTRVASQLDYRLGAIQSWIERLGVDSQISAISSRIARDGKRYAMGGWDISVDPSQRPVIIAANQQLDFDRELDTKGYPPGAYRYYLEYKDLSGNILQVLSSDFDLEIPGTACDVRVPNPILAYKYSEKGESSGGNYTRYSLTVTNRSSYDAGLFVTAPDLPPCGLNTESSRTWVDIYDNKGKYIYGFCGLSDPNDLDLIWFAVMDGQPKPDGVYIVLKDRRCKNQYSSDILTLQ